MSHSDASTEVSVPVGSHNHGPGADDMDKLEAGNGQDVEDGGLVESKSSAVPPPIASDAPDGGFKAWLQVAAAWFLFFNPWGMVNAFGAFQTYYDANLGQPPSNISWIGTFQGFLLLFVGVVTGPVYDRGYLHVLIGGGAFFMVFGMMMTSISTEYYQVFLAQGVCIGLGSGLLFVPSVAVVVQWFNRKRPLAMGIVATGGSIGAVIFPIIFRRLLTQIGFGWATRVLGFIMLATLTFSFTIVKRRVAPTGAARALIDVKALRSPVFWAATIGLFFAFMGLYLPFFYVSSWAASNVGTDTDLSFYLLSIMNAGSLFGRLLPGIVAMHVGSVNLMFTFVCMAAILLFAWISVSTVATTVVFCIFYGFFSGAVVSLPPTVVASITPSVHQTGTWMGMSFGLASLGLLIGNPIAGAIIDAQGGSYVGAQCFGGACAAVAAIGFVTLIVLRRRAGAGWAT